MKPPSLSFSHTGAWLKNRTRPRVYTFPCAGASLYEVYTRTYLRGSNGTFQGDPPNLRQGIVKNGDSSHSRVNQSSLSTGAEFLYLKFRSSIRPLLLSPSVCIFCKLGSNEPSRDMSKQTGRHGEQKGVNHLIQCALALRRKQREICQSA